MATNYYQDKIFQCSKCQYYLTLKSKTLTCLHSLCERCLEEEFQGETYGNGQCPECQEPVKIDQLTLSPFLVISLKRRRLESTEWECEDCWEKGNNSLAKFWCKGCDRLICDECKLFQMYSLEIVHDLMELDGKGKDEVQKAMRTDLCNIHKKVKECYCDRCNVCLCNTCYKKHLDESPQCPSHPISVKEEAVKKRTSQGPTLLQEMEDLKNNLQEKNRKSQIYCKQLEMDYDFKCKEIWQNYDDILEELRKKTNEMCEELRILKDEQVKKWRELVEENERLLKQLKIWHVNLCYFLGKDDKDKNEMICGVELVGSKLASSSIHPPLQMIIDPMKKCELRLKYSDFWLQFIEGLKNEMIASKSLNCSANSIHFETEWNLPESNVGRDISSILISQKDDHIFLADWWNNSIMEFTELGEIISEFILIDKGKEFHPREMFLTSSEMLGVNSREKGSGEEKLFLLERINFSPFLKIKNIVDTKKQQFPLSFSVCNIKKKMLVCDQEKFQIDFYTENGEYIKSIDTGESRGWFCRPPMIRADFSTGNVWGAIPDTRKIFCFDENGKKLKSFETKEKILDFSINEFGNIYFTNEKGIFSFLPEKKMHEFKQKSESFPRIFVSSEKVFVCLKIDVKYFIKIFKILD